MLSDSGNIGYGGIRFYSDIPFSGKDTVCIKIIYSGGKHEKILLIDAQVVWVEEMAGINKKFFSVGAQFLNLSQTQKKTLKTIISNIV